MPLTISNTFTVRILISSPTYDTSAVFPRSTAAVHNTPFIAMHFSNSHYSAMALKAASATSAFSSSQETQTSSSSVSAPTPLTSKSTQTASSLSYASRLSSAVFTSTSSK